MTERYGIDIGNSRVKIFRLPEGELPRPAVDLVAAATTLACTIWPEDDPDSLPADADIEMVAVRPELATRLGALLAARGCAVRRWSAAELPIENPYDDPARLGPDRPLAAYAARHLVGAPAVVVDAGTAVTVDLVDGAGRFAGGAIAPGFDLVCRALGEGGAMLETVARPRLDYPGRGTTEALELGATAAFLGAIRLLVDAALEQEPGARVLITGGRAEGAKLLLRERKPLEAPLLAIGLWLLSREPRP